LNHFALGVKVQIKVAEDVQIIFEFQKRKEAKENRRDIRWMAHFIQQMCR